MHNESFNWWVLQSSGLIKWLTVYTPAISAGEGLNKEDVL